MEAFELVAEALANRDPDALREAVWLLNRDYAAAPLLAHALLEDWHDSHEDIVFELGLIGNAHATESIARAATMRFESLVKWGNVHEFQRKCAYALAKIGTEDSKLALERLCEAREPELRQFAQEGLQNWASVQ